MHNILFSIGDYTIYSYGVLIAIGIISGMILLRYRLDKYNQGKEKAIDMMLVALIPGFIGAKLNYLVVNYTDISNGLKSFKIFGHGFVIYGGVLFGMIGVFIYCLIKKLNIGEYMDTGIASVAIAQGFGRLGCFMSGCCYGIEYSGPLSVTFTNSTYAPNGVSLVPSQLLFSAANFINCIILCIAKKRNKIPGTTMVLYMITYGIGRFALEFIRGDSARGTIFGMSTAQFTSICMVIIGGFTYGIVVNKYNRKQAKLENENGENQSE